MGKKKLASKGSSRKKGIKKSPKKVQARKSHSDIKPDYPHAPSEFGRVQKREHITPSYCFVIMPSGNHGEYKHDSRESDFVFESIIKPAVKDALGDQIKIEREADRRVPGAIDREIVRNTALADVVVVDITGQNPNVFFELGMRYALRPSTTILIRQKGTKIPFDINTYRCVEYDPMFEGISKSKQEICSAINEAIRTSKERSDSLVFDVFPKLFVKIPGMMAVTGEHLPDSLMPWEEYLNYVRVIINRLTPFYEQGKYVPEIIIGISNGGMIFADLLGMDNLFWSLPKFALWADRKEQNANFFNNCVNDAIVRAIPKLVGHRRPIDILLVDDIIASGYTSRRAVSYLSQEMPKANVKLLPLVSRSDRFLTLFRESLLWFSAPFDYSDQEAYELHSTTRDVLPYYKDIKTS